MAKTKKKTPRKAKRSIDRSSDGIEQYVHSDKERPYNPPVGLVTPETDKVMPKKMYSFDPHLEPNLQWAGKAEHSNFEVDTVSLHVHERLDPMTIVEGIMKRQEQTSLISWFEQPQQNPPIREAIQFYKHSQNWSNRLIAGDSLLVINSLLQKESMAGKIQMIYIDPPYGIKYGSNFQPFVNRRDVKDGKDEDLTQEPEMVRAFRDTWELGIHSYLTYLQDRLLLSKELLTESGSCFVQINDENLNLVTTILDEVFGKSNFVGIITFRKKTMPLGAKLIENVSDHIVWYAKDKEKVKYRTLFVEKNVEGDSHWNYVELSNSTRRKMTIEEINNHKLLPKNAFVYQLKALWGVGFNPNTVFPLVVNGRKYLPPQGKSWPTGKDGMERLVKANRIEPYADGETIRYVLRLKDYPVVPLTTLWSDTSAPSDMIFVVQTNVNVVARCMLMTTDPGDLVFDPTCGSGTTAYVAEQWGRRWITCDTSRVAIALTKQRLMTAVYDYYELAHPEEGVSSGFKYKMVPHITLGSIANNEPSNEEVLYDQPLIDKTKRRVTGPFTVEAVPSQRVLTLNESENLSNVDLSVGRSGETVRMTDWIGELYTTGIRGKSGQKIEFLRIEPLSGTTYLHAEGETKESDPKRVVISFGPDYSPLEKSQVELAIQEAQKLVPKPKIIIFASFQFDPEAAKDIDELNWPGVTVLKAQMNTDLLTADLKKKRSGNESFWLVGQPDIALKKQGHKYIVNVEGFDYYNPKTGAIESGDIRKVAMWMLDTDYDGRSLYPDQIFLPMAGDNEGWGKLAKSLKAVINEDALEKVFKGDTSLPFELGSKKRIAVKIIDDRGIESLKVLDVK